MKKLSIPITSQEKRLGWVCLFAHIILLPTLLTEVNRYLARPLSENIINIIYFSVSFCCVLLIFHRFLWNSLPLGLQRLWQTLKGAFLGFAVYQLSSYLLSMLITALMPDFFNVNDSTISSASPEYFNLLKFGIILLVPIAEETLYRGLVFRVLYDKQPIVAYGLSAIVFASIHVIAYIGLYPPVHLLLCLLQYLPAGVCLAWAYVKADTIWAPIAMHIAINQIGLAAMR